MSDEFEIKWDGLDLLKEKFDEMENELKRIAVEEYNNYALLVEEGAKALSPKDSGDLEASITTEKAKFTGTTVHTAVGSNMKYALRRHEAPYRKGTFPKYDNGAKFPDYYVDGRGEITRSKPSWRGQIPGRKYLQNAINATENDYFETNERILRRTLKGDKP